MRVYGTSPLYSYVELVFRSKRLFIGSIIIASLAATFFYFFRANSYTARTLVLLTGTQTPNPDDREQKGTIDYKVSILSLVLRDPEFIKKALDADHLNQIHGRDMTTDEFDKFAKEAREHISYSVAENVLEIACTWPDERAANIVNAIYGAYSRRVVEEETFVSSTNTKLVSALLDEYTQQRNSIEKKVAQYLKERALTLTTEPGPATAAYQQALAELTRLKSEQLVSSAKFRLLQDQYKHTPPTYVESVVFPGVAKDPAYIAAKDAEVEATRKLQELKQRYTDNHPLVKAAKEQLASATSTLKSFSRQGGAMGGHKGPVLTQTEAANQEYLSLSEKIKQAEIDMNALNQQVVQAEIATVQARDRAQKTPDEQYNYRRMTDNLGLYSSFQNQFATKLEQAKMDEERDNAYKLQEIKQVVKPESEKDNKGARGLLILAAGPLIGLILAFAFSLLSETMDHSVRTPMEVEKFLGKPVLAVLPRIRTSPEGANRHISGGDRPQGTLPSSDV